MHLDVKICGMTNRDDAMAALEAGADYVGFIVYEKSLRGIRASALRRLLEKHGEITGAVGVFVNMPAAEVASIAADCGLAAVQIHGDEAPAGFEGGAVPVWRAVRQRDGQWAPVPDAWPAERYVVDATVPGQYGGTGIKADWDAAAKLAETQRIMLSGGLTPAEVAEAVRRVRPLGVDVASGVEREPGKKDRRAVADFIRAAKSAR